MRKIFSFFLLPLLLLIIVPTSFAAENLKSQKIITVAKDQVVDGNFYGAGEIVEILGTVDGDVYVAGGQVIIDGIINGDLLVAGGTVNIAGVVNGDVRAAGGQLNVNAIIERNLTIAGGNIDISNASHIGKALQLIGGNLTTSAPVTEETLVMGGNLTYRGQTGKNLEAKVGTLRIAPGSEIAGNFDYWASEEALIDEGAIVSGTTTKHEVSQELKNLQGPNPEAVKNFFKGVELFATLTGIITTLIFGLILIRLFPNCAESAINAVQTRALASLGFGILTMIIFPILFVLLLITGIGIPLAFISLTLFIIFTYYARIYVILAIGQWLNLKVSKSGNPFVSLTLGIIVYYAIGYLPVIGDITKMLIIPIGLGAGLISAKALYQKARDQKII